MLMLKMLKECSVPVSCESGLHDINVSDGKATKLVSPPPGFDPLMPAQEIPIRLAADPVVKSVPAMLLIALNSIPKMPYCCEPGQKLEPVLEVKNSKQKMMERMQWKCSELAFCCGSLTSQVNLDMRGLLLRLQERQSSA